MGFFRKKRPTVDELSEPATPEPARAAPPPTPEPKPAPKPPAPKPPSYGIDDAIALMRDLPQTENIDLVVQVIKRTLESTRVDVAAIIEDGITKQHSLENQVKTLEREIAALHQELGQRREEIAALKADYQETRATRDLLVRSRSLDIGATVDAPAAVPTPSPPVPAARKLPTPTAPKPPARAASADATPNTDEEDTATRTVDDNWGEDTDVPLTVDATTLPKARHS